MNVFAAVIAGLVGTIVITMVMAMAPKMGLPKMDMVGLLGTMFGKASRPLGLFIHLMMGVAFALIYAFAWTNGFGSPVWHFGVIFGAIHWLIVGMSMAMIPIMHAGIKSGNIPAPGAYMMKNGGIMAFTGGLIGHAIFGLTVALVYAAF